MRGGGQVLRFSRLLVKNWRGFLRAYVELHPRTFLVGPAAAGKSNFLDVFCFLRDTAAPGGGFQEAVEARGGVPRLRCLAARQDSDLGLLVHAGPRDHPAEWEYELHFNQEGSSLPLIRRERLARRGKEIFLRPDEADLGDSERLTLSYLERGRLDRQVREFAAFLTTVRYLNLVPLAMRESDRSGEGRKGETGAGILEDIAATTEKSRNSRLRLILEELRAAVPRLRQLESVRDAHGRPHLRALLEHWRPHGAWQSEDQFSDGTLRLVGILWESLSADGPLLIEEPEHSLHEEIVRLVPGMLARLGRRTGRQMIVTTHSRDLLAEVSGEEVLLLCPGDQGVVLRSAGAPTDAADLLSGKPLQATPADDRQMGLFGEERTEEAQISEQ